MEVRRCGWTQAASYHPNTRPGEMRCQLLRPLGTPEGSVVIAWSLSAGCLAGRPAAGGPEAGLPRLP